MADELPYGVYKGRLEKKPGKMIYRYKGCFVSEARARMHQKILSAKGHRAKVVKMREDDHPYHLYVMAKHDFWKKAFILDERK